MRTRELAVSITEKISKLLYGNTDQDATFEELGHSKNVLLAKEIFEIFLENMGTRQGRKYREGVGV